jgi:hypothetical protein
VDAATLADQSSTDATLFVDGNDVLTPVNDVSDASALSDVPVARDLEAIEPASNCIVPTADAASVHVSVDVPYLTIGGETERLDVAWPISASSHLRPIVVAIHGGGWTMGTKAGLDAVVVQLANVGYVAATLDYRLYQPTCPGADRRLQPGPVSSSDPGCAVRHPLSPCTRSTVRRRPEPSRSAWNVGGGPSRGTCCDGARRQRIRRAV